MSTSSPRETGTGVQLRSWLRSWRAFGPAVLILVGTVVVVWHLGRIREDQLLAQERARVEKRLNELGSTLTAAINHRQAIVTGLAVFAELHGSDESLRREFVIYAAGLHANDPVIRAIQIHPPNGPILTYPVDANEAVRGRTLHDLINDERPTVRAAVARAIQSRTVTLSEPYELRQGGLGVVARRAVYRGGEFWGMAAVVVNLQPLLDRVGLSGTASELRIALSDATNRVFHGDAAVLAADPAYHRVPLPEGAWVLSGLPRQGWRDAGRLQVNLLRLAGFLTALLLGGLTYGIAGRWTALAHTLRAQTRKLGERETDYRRMFEEAEKARAAADAARTRIAETLERISDGFGALNREWRYTYVNPKLAEMVDRRREDMIGRHIWTLFPEAVGTPVHKAYLQAMAEQRTIELEHYYAPLERWFEHRFYPSSAGLSVFSRDITIRRRAEEAARAAQAESARLLVETEQGRRALLSVIEDLKAAEAALRAGEERYRSLVETSFDWVWEVDVRGRYTYASPRVADLLGYTVAEVLGRTPFDLMPELEAIRVRASFEKFAAAQQSFAALENVNRHRDGRLVVLETSGVPTFAPDGTWIGYRGMDRDITARRAAEKDLRLRGAALEAAANAILITDRSGVIEWANPAFATLSGWTLDEAVGRNPRDLVKSGQHDPVYYRHMWETILAGRVWRGEIVNRRKDGTLRTVDMTIAPVRDETGEISHFIAIKQDVTDQKNLEAQFLQAQRMEAIGTLAGGIAHDLNNILAPILLVADMLKERAANESDRELLAMTQTSARRGTEVIRQLLTFSRGQEGERSIVQPRHLMREVVDMMRETFPREIDIRLHVPKDLWPVVVDPTQLHQVLLNLCVNARDAMSEGGCLALTAANVTLAAGDAPLPPGAKPGLYVTIETSDTGHGIPPEIRQRIFDPFFTTKPLGKGTGLGLSTVLGIVRSHAGFITVDSTPGKGSSFKVYLPAVPDQTTVAVDTPAMPAAPPGPRPTILVVDDERSIRDATRTLLEWQTYHVITATNGEDALTQYLKHRSEIRLVLTDLMMPVMNGLALIRALRAISSDLKIIATSGLADDAHGRELANLGVRDVLPKPSDGVALLAVVSRLLKED